MKKTLCLWVLVFSGFSVGCATTKQKTWHYPVHTVVTTTSGRAIEFYEILYQDGEYFPSDILSFETEVGTVSIPLDLNSVQKFEVVEIVRRQSLRQSLEGAKNWADAVNLAHKIVNTKPGMRIRISFLNEKTEPVESFITDYASHFIKGRTPYGVMKIMLENVASIQRIVTPVYQ